MISEDILLMYIAAAMTALFAYMVVKLFAKFRW